MGKQGSKSLLGLPDPGCHRRMTDTTPNLTIPGPAVAERRVRVDVLNKVLTELVSRIRKPESESAGLLWIALENGQAIAETIEGTLADE